jgi:AraC-like DNA-binding protein
MMAHAFEQLVSVLSAEGLSPSDVFRNYDLQAVMRDIEAYPTETQNQLFMVALSATQQPALGVRLGRELNVCTQGMFGYALLSASTLGETLDLFIRYATTLLPSLRFTKVIENDQVWIYADARGLPTALDAFFKHLVFTTIIVTRRFLIGDVPTVETFAINHPPSEDDDALAATFQNIQCNAERTALIFPRIGLQIPVQTADPIAKQIFKRECDRVMHQSRAKGITSARVQDELLASGSAYPKLAHMAARLSMSESTLRRRLLDEGLRYQDILDDVRLKVATEYLLRTTLPVADIAELLGFCDAASFRKSFNRWTGRTPNAFRTTEVLTKQ